MMRDKVVFSNDIELMSEKCVSCESKAHHSSQCERLHLQANREKIFYAQNSSKVIVDR